MFIKCLHCGKNIQIDNKTLFSETDILCTSCKRKNKLYYKVSLKIIKVIYVILAILSFNIVFNMLRYNNLTIAIVVGFLTMILSALLLIPIYKYVFKHFYNK